MVEFLLVSGDIGVEIVFIGGDFIVVRMEGGIVL